MTDNARTLSALEANGPAGIMMPRVAMCCRMCRWRWSPPGAPAAS